ncbi:MAG: hypothetical protein JKY30_13850 [Flavobacteriales bacterium]|nr:hypothetical protein [Flavobacteriales bacterium]
MKKLKLIIVFSLICAMAEAQSVQITGVRGREFRGVSSILDSKNNAVGHYTFYVGEKVKKGLVEFVLEIYDLDLKLIKKTPIQLPKNAIMQGGEFNGKDFMFMFFDYKKKSNIFITFDSKGEIIKKVSKASRKGVTAGTTKIFPSRDGSGFYVTKQVKEKRWGYAVEKFDRNITSKWKKTISRPKGMISIASAVGGDDRFVVVSIEQPTLMSKKRTAKVISHNGQTGDKEYEVNLYDGKISRVPSAFLIDEKGNFIMSGMYYEGPKFTGPNSDGIYFTKISPEGKVLFENSLDWKGGDIQKALKATSKKTSIGSKPKVMFHDITVDENGKYQVVAETFRKTVRGGAMAAKLLAGASGGGSAGTSMGFTVMDFIIFNYDAEGKPIDINKIAKPYKSITVEAAGQLTGIKLAAYMKSLGLFTYNFISETKSGKKVVVFTNFEKPKGVGKGKPYVGISSIEIGENSETKKMPLMKKLTNFGKGGRNGAIKSKPGKITTYYYDKKAKAINIEVNDYNF